MASQVSYEDEDLPTLSESFDVQLKKCLKIENSELPSTDQELQKDIQSTITRLEELTLHISYLGIFSSNESIEEITTSSVKFLMLPVLLGSLTLKLLKSEREDTLKIALVYFKDFIRRCKNYQLTNSSLGDEDFEPAIQPKPVVNSRPTTEDLKRMSKQRDEKILRYREKKALSEKLTALSKAIENPSQDEEIVREYYLTLINQFIYQSFDEIESINLELSMLQRMKQAKLDPEPTALVQQEPPKPLRPFLITKDAAHKKVFGAGYPSLPILSVEEFYEQRVKDGWFPPRSSGTGCSSLDHKVSAGNNLKQKKSDEDEETEGDEENDDQEIEKLRQRDEWRDVHKRGWGNTYNRS